MPSRPDQLLLNESRTSPSAAGFISTIEGLLLVSSYSAKRFALDGAESGEMPVPAKEAKHHGLAGVGSPCGEWLRRNTVSKETYAPLCTNLSVLPNTRSSPSMVLMNLAADKLSFSTSWKRSLSGQLHASGSPPPPPTWPWQSKLRACVQADFKPFFGLSEARHAKMSQCS